LKIKIFHLNFYVQLIARTEKELFLWGHLRNICC